MPKSITSGVAKLSLEQSKRTKKKTTREERRQKRLLYEEWVYGFHLKNKHLRMAAEKYKLRWQTRPGPTMLKLISYFERASGVDFSCSPVVYRDRPGLIITFVKDDGRKRLEKNTFSHEDMDKVREIIGRPTGTKPKWFDVSGDDIDGELSSEDEQFPDTGFRPNELKPSWPCNDTQESTNIQDEYDSSGLGFDDAPESNLDDTSDEYLSSEEE
ncbi:uncharacterized protein FOMMEDRAFT_168447 [Fomitiporia mediterranea MF3/22]|uniref:uncharacterized protein n=1 Tax=Fomitiporia mediterranea (strain MF3/22) TaxID=694068 RepID=UPI0004409B4E|nr:uncharacterized protein FOMMEDRAFT_168447 [Fomitiporia mediterranea MF3/22]EJD01833.1 hypothetical protein FOMMEDRAFT_168447 [Fomitiporia mediterranea MF3/22]